MKDHNAPSYDLNQAQLILNSLIPTSPGQPPVLPPATDEAGFVRLSRKDVPAVEPPPAAAARPLKGAEAEEKWVVPPLFRTWEDCICWCMEVTRAEAAFVVDSQGFIIASRGRLPGRGIECTGAEMVCSVELLERVDPDAGKLAWIDLDFDRRRIAGFIAPIDDNDYFIVGLLSPEPGYHAHKRMLSRQILESLPTID